MSPDDGPVPEQGDSQLIDRLLSVPEGPAIEFKRASADNASKLKTIVAFMNTEGGLLVIGMEDPEKAKGRDRVFGVQENEESIDELRRMVRQRITPIPTAPEYSEPQFHPLTCELRDGRRGSIVIVDVAKSGGVHSIVDGGTYARLGKSNRQLSAAEITDLSMARGVQPWVRGLARIDCSLLDTNWWREYSQQRRLTRPIDQALLHLGLARVDADGALRPTRAAVLLFAEEPSGLLDSKAAIRVTRYVGDEIDRTPNTNLARPPKTIGGPLIEQIREAREAVINALATGIEKGPLGFELVQKYPLRVLEEAITNAVLHRDYRVQEDVHVRVFDGRVEIESPGRLPSAVTLGNIGVIGSRPRNRDLAAHLREFPMPPNLDAREGVPMMFATMGDRISIRLSCSHRRSGRVRRSSLLASTKRSPARGTKSTPTSPRTPTSATPRFGSSCGPTRSRRPNSCALGSSSDCSSSRTRSPPSSIAVTAGPARVPGAPCFQSPGENTMGQRLNLMVLKRLRRAVLLRQCRAERDLTPIAAARRSGNAVS